MTHAEAAATAATPGLALGLGGQGGAVCWECGHWPGKTPADQVKQMIVDVRNGWNNRYTAPNGETIYRKADVILIENPPTAEGTIFQPHVNALEYFRRCLRRNPGGT